VEVGGYRLAWVGYAEPEEPKTVRPVAERGFDSGYLKAANITWADAERGHGPTGTAIRTGEIQVARKILHQPDFAPWRAAALRYGYASSVALPLVGDDRVWGALNIYAGEEDAFDEAEIALLSQLAGDLTYGIQSLHVRAERRAATENIRRLNAELEQRVAERTHELTLANKELESFSYSVSHDLRAPLRAINGFASIIARRYRDNLNAEAQHYLDNIVQASERMSRLIDDLLKYSRLGRAGVRLEPIQLNRILSGIQAEMKAHLEELHGTLLVPDDIPTVKGDSTLLTQVFTNLVENAVKYRRPEVDLLVEITARVENDQVIIGVCDNGIGIPAEYLEKIFNIFQRLHNEDEYPGTGIGLATVKKSVELVGGKVWAESVVREGSRFFVKLISA
jgi:signal transduction histidine kinase